MWLLLNACNQWLRTHLGWSNSAAAWKERLAFVALFAAAVLLYWKRAALSAPVQTALWFGLAFAAAVMLRRGWLKLFGPVLFYDLVRLGRRSRYILLRTVYVLALLLILLYVHFVWTIDYRNSEGPMPVQRMAEFAEWLFRACVIVQLVLAVILTPAYVAGAIAEEKDRQTLEYLLATDLRNGEIVLSKLFARLANMMLIILAGLPVLSFVQFFGGVDPDLLLAAFAATALLVLSLAGVSIVCSVHARKPRDAIILTYFIVVTYHGVSFLAGYLADKDVFEIIQAFTIGLLAGVGPYLLPPSPFAAQLFAMLSAAVASAEPAWLENALWAFNSGNIVYSVRWVYEAANNPRTTVRDTLGQVLRAFAIFHGLVFVASSAWAVLRLRRIALKEAGGRAGGLASIIPRLRRPPVAGQPMLWKEIFVEGGVRFGWVGRVIVGLLVLGSFVPVLFIVQSAVLDYGASEYARVQLARAMNAYARIVGTLVAWLSLFAVAVRAAGCLSGERDRQTFDGLMTTPLDAPSILFAKWLGSIASARLAWLWLGLIWMAAAVAGGLQPGAVPLLIAAWLVYAGVLACVGMWFSLVCRTTLRATVWTLLTSTFLFIGHWAVTGLCCFLPVSVMAHSSGRDVEYIAMFQFGQTPPFVLALLAFRGDELSGRRAWDETLQLFGFSIIGLGAWLLGGLVLAAITSQRFQELTLRQDVRLPESDQLAGRTTPARPVAPPPVYQAIVVENVPEPPAPVQPPP